MYCWRCRNYSGPISVLNSSGLVKFMETNLRMSSQSVSVCVLRWFKWLIIVCRILPLFSGFFCNLALYLAQRARRASGLHGIFANSPSSCLFLRREIFLLLLLFLTSDYVNIITNSPMSYSLPRSISVSPFCVSVSSIKSAFRPKSIFLVTAIVAR